MSKLIAMMIVVAVLVGGMMVMSGMSVDALVAHVAALWGAVVSAPQLGPLALGVR